MPAVCCADEAVHVKIHFGDKIVAVEKLMNEAKPLHLEVIIPDLLARLPKIHTSLHLAGALL